MRPMESGYCSVGEVLHKVWQKTANQLVEGRVFSPSELVIARKNIETIKNAFYKHKNSCKVCKKVSELPNYKTER